MRRRREVRTIPVVLYGGGVVGLVMLAFWVWAIFDVISTDESLCRNLPKGVWLLLVIFVPNIGGIAWLLLGRPEGTGFRPGDTSPRPRRVVAPEDSPRWEKRLDDRLGSHETERERLSRERKEWLAQMDAELDRRIESKMSTEAERLQQWEEDLRRREQRLHDDEGAGGPTSVTE